MRPGPLNLPFWAGKIIELAKSIIFNKSMSCKTKYTLKECMFLVSIYYLTPMINDFEQRLVQLVTFAQLARGQGHTSTKWRMGLEMYCIF